MTDNLPQMLYRYRSLGGSWPYLINELRGHVWCSKAQSLNDPFDGVAFTEPESRKTVTEMHGKILTSDMQYVWCVACFSETWDNPTMWANYGDNFFGICLEYDIEKIRNRLSIIDERSKNQMTAGNATILRGTSFGPVDYLQNLPSSFKSEQEAIFAKHDTWKYEHEWRLAMKYGFGNHPNGPEYGRPSYLEGTLKEIILPSSINGANWQAIRAVRDAFCPDVPISRITPVASERRYQRSKPMY